MYELFIKPADYFSCAFHKGNSTFSSYIFHQFIICYLADDTTVWSTYIMYLINVNIF
jgi:hypothetical protein